MTKLTKADEKRATDALARCASETKHIDDPVELNKKAFDILYADLGDKPELLKRACEGYNSAKSIYRLGAATDDTRGDNFALLNAPEMARMAAERGKKEFISKTATAYGFKKAQFRCESETAHRPLSKTASAAPTKLNEAPVTMRKLSSAEVRGEAVSFIEDIHYSLRKVASAYKRACDNVPESEDRFISCMDKLTPGLKKQAAELLNGAYGSIGDMLVELYNVSRPMSKVASYAKDKYKGDVAVPKTDVFNAAWDVLTAHVMAKEANKIASGFADSALTMMKDIFTCSRPAISKTASSGIPQLLLGEEIINSIKMSDEKSKADIEKDIMTSELSNTLKKHSVKRAFMHTVADPTVSRYPLHQVTTAFNDALAELPVHMREIPPSAFSALLKSRTVARLGRGGAASASDVDQIQSIQQAYSRVSPTEIITVEQQGSRK